MHEIDPFSLTTVPVQQFANGQPMNSATAFVWKQGPQHYLITNWHVITGHPADAADGRSIDAALKACGLDWSQQRLGELRAHARQLVRNERRNIMRVANELLRVRTLTVDEIHRLVG
jgi:hypothetical protein